MCSVAHFKIVAYKLRGCDADLIGEQSRCISSRSDLKRRSLRLFEEVAQQEEQDEQRYEVSFW